MSLFQSFVYPKRLDLLLTEVRPTVVLIDMQPEFLKELYQKEVEYIVENQLKVMKTCEQESLNFILLEYTQSGDTLPGLKEASLQIPHSVQIHKSCDGGFESCGFEKQLQRWQTKDLFLMGMNAHACVYSTALVGKIKGYEVMTAECVLGDEFGIFGLVEARHWFRKNGIYLKEQSGNTWEIFLQRAAEYSREGSWKE